jgi:hypothetical protein
MAGCRIEPGEEAAKVTRGADEPSRRCGRPGWIAARNDEAPANRQLRAVAAGHGRRLCQRHVGLGFEQLCRFDDLMPDPAAVGLACKGFDDQPCKAVAVIGIFEARAGVDHGCGGERRAQLRLVRKSALVQPLAAVGSVANDACAVGEQLGHRRLGDRRMQPPDMTADRLIEGDPSLLAQLHNARCREAL